MRRVPRVLVLIQEAVSSGNFDLTEHALEEMAEDGLSLADIESAVLFGTLSRTQTDDPRGPRFTVVGAGRLRGVEVGIVGRFVETGAFLVITAFRVSDRED